MVLVKLKMKPIYKIFLCFIAILCIILIFLGILATFSHPFENNFDIEVKEPLSINYQNGKDINVSKKHKYKFSITNSSNKVEYYNIVLSKIRGKGTYKLNSKDIKISEGKLKNIDEIVLNTLSIDAYATNDYELEIINHDETSLLALLSIRNQIVKNYNFKDNILKNINPSEISLTKIGDEIAENDEGLIKSFDDIGVSYYFRGNIQNNYVLFADFLWRIVRINGDGTVRIILEDPINELSSYYNGNTLNFKFKDSTLKKNLDLWLNIYLKDYLNYISISKFCNDISTDDKYNFNSYTRIYTNKIPTLNCLGDSYSTNIGILNIDEVILAGAAPYKQNTKYYLYNPNIDNVWYTMSGAKGTNNSLNLFMIDNRGNIIINIEGNLNRQVRPVINLIKNIEMEGKGTIEEPYQLKK